MLYPAIDFTGINKLKQSCGLYSTVVINSDLPRKLKKNERKPWVTHITELKRIARQEKKEKQMVNEKILRPPENGLLVKELVPIAHEVYAAQKELFACASRVAKRFAIYTCRCVLVFIYYPSLINILRVMIL